MNKYKYYLFDLDGTISESALGIRESLENAIKSMGKPLPNLDDYDEIYLGYPNYCGTMPMAVYTFLEAFDFTGKKIHPFCTHEGSGLSNTVNDIKNTAKGATVTNGLPLFGSDADKAEGIVNDWIKKFNYTRR